MAGNSGGVSVIAALVLGTAIVVGSLVLKGAIDGQTEALGSVQSALADLGDAVRGGGAPRPAAARPAARAPAPAPNERQEVDVDGSPALGPEKAAVTLVEFGDFQCPFCGRVQPTLDQIRKTYGDRVRIVYKHLPLRSIHPRAAAAAAAAEAAGEQGKFWQMHDLIFADQHNLSDQQLAAYAQQLGLDMDRFQKDMASAAVQKRIQRDEQQAIQLGVSGTPAFFINGRFLSGAQPFESFKSIIDQELSQG